MSDEILNYAANVHQNQGEQAGENNSGEAAMADNATNTANDSNANTAEMAGGTNQVAEAQQPEQQQESTDVNYDTWVNEFTGGIFQNKESLKENLEKFKNYDQISAKASEMEEKLKQDPFVNSYVKGLNDLYSKGAPVDQIKAYQKINSLGNIDEMDPLEAKVAKMVFDGYGEEMARKIVNQEYALSDYDTDSEEYQIQQEKLKVSSKADKEFLKNYKHEIESYENPSVKEAEQARLQSIAAEEARMAQIKQAAPRIAESIKGLNPVSVVVDKDGDPIEFSDNFSEEFKKELPAMAEYYFSDTKAEINDENVNDFRNYVRAEYLNRNHEAILEAAIKHTYAKAMEAADRKYENRSGLPSQTEHEVTTSATDGAKELAEFMSNVANRGWKK